MRSWVGELLPLHFPPIGVAYLSAFLKQKEDVEIAVLDTSLDFAGKARNIAAAVQALSPDLIGITVYSNLVNENRAIAADVRKVTAAPIVAGGPHISVAGREFLAETGIEYGVMRDGEVPLWKLIRALAAQPTDEALSSIPGLIFRDRAGNIAARENTDLIHDLDEIPFPDWSVFDLEKYPLWRNKWYPLITSRGCPYNCTYCAAPLVTGRKFRVRSAANIVREIETYVAKGFRRFGIADDAFNVDLDRAKEVCRLIIEKDQGIVWDMANGIRANTVDREFFQLLKKAGCNFVGFGLESGNEAMLKRIRKGLRVEDVVKALEYAREAGVGTAVNFIIGHPGETYQTALDTLRVAERIPASYVNIYGLMPMKGTEADRELRALEKEGAATFFYDQDYYLSHFSAQGIEPVFETPEFTREQRRALLIRARNITKKTAMQYRLGPVLGRLLYTITRPPAVFDLMNRLRQTAMGEYIYHRLRREE